MGDKDQQFHLHKDISKWFYVKQSKTNTSTLVIFALKGQVYKSIRCKIDDILSTSSTTTLSASESGECHFEVEKHLQCLIIAMPRVVRLGNPLSQNEYMVPYYIIIHQPVVIPISRSMNSKLIYIMPNTSIVAITSFNDTTNQGVGAVYCRDWCLVAYLFSIVGLVNVIIIILFFLVVPVNKAIEFS